MLLQCTYGYGTPLTTLSEDDVQSIFKASLTKYVQVLLASKLTSPQSNYAATIVFFASLGFSKLAIGAFIHNLTPSKLHRRINFGICGVIGLWTVTAMLSAAFQCGLPHPWDLRKTCFDHVSRSAAFNCSAS